MEGEQRRMRRRQQKFLFATQEKEKLFVAIFQEFFFVLQSACSTSIKKSSVKQKADGKASVLLCYKI